MMGGHNASKRWVFGSLIASAFQVEACVRVAWQPHELELGTRDYVMS